MNLALHGLLLQVIVTLLNFKHGFVLCSAGEPGYLDFDNLPETNFSCQGKVIGGYYADVEAGCQMFHVCTVGQKDEIMDIKFLCLNGTVFDQETRVCERVDEVDCSKSERFYNLNLELYGNNAVTLSLQENNGDEEPTESLDEHRQQQHTTSARPSTSLPSFTTTTTIRPNLSTTPQGNNEAFQAVTGYPQHYQPQPPFPQVQTSQSKTIYEDENGGYHHQYIFHNNERNPSGNDNNNNNNNNQATSYQVFGNQGSVSSSTGGPPQVHQVRYSSTANPQVIHNEPSTVTPIFHSSSSTIQTLLNNNNANGPAIINPIFHNHGIASTTEQFTVHNNNPRETSGYQDETRRPLEAVQSTNKGKVSKLTISPVPNHHESSRVTVQKSSSESQRVSGQPLYQGNPVTVETTVKSFYPTPRSSSQKPPTASNQPTEQITTQHIHVPPPQPIPQLKPHQITINLPPPDIQRIVQNPSPLLPSQSRVIVTAKASVSDESGRPLNTSELVTLPIPTIPASYDDYKEGDESFDPFYRDVPKIRTNRNTYTNIRKDYRHLEGLDEDFLFPESLKLRRKIRKRDTSEVSLFSSDVKDFQDIRENLQKFRALLLGEVGGVEEVADSKKVESEAGGTKGGKDNGFSEDEESFEREETKYRKSDRSSATRPRSRSRNANLRRRRIETDEESAPSQFKSSRHLETTDDDVKSRKRKNKRPRVVSEERLLEGEEEEDEEEEEEIAKSRGNRKLTREEIRSRRKDEDYDEEVPEDSETEATAEVSEERLEEEEEEVRDEPEEVLEAEGKRKSSKKQQKPLRDSEEARLEDRKSRKKGSSRRQSLEIEEEEEEEEENFKPSRKNRKPVRQRGKEEEEEFVEEKRSSRRNRKLAQEESRTSRKLKEQEVDQNVEFLQNEKSVEEEEEEDGRRKGGRGELLEEDEDLFLDDLGSFERSPKEFEFPQSYEDYSEEEPVRGHRKAKGKSKNSRFPISTESLEDRRVKNRKTIQPRDEFQEDYPATVKGSRRSGKSKRVELEDEVELIADPEDYSEEIDSDRRTKSLKTIAEAEDEEEEEDVDGEEEDDAREEVEEDYDVIEEPRERSSRRKSNRKQSVPETSSKRRRPSSRNGNSPKRIAPASLPSIEEEGDTSEEKTQPDHVPEDAGITGLLPNSLERSNTTGNGNQSLELDISFLKNTSTLLLTEERPEDDRDSKLEQSTTTQVVPEAPLESQNKIPSSTEDISLDNDTLNLPGEDFWSKGSKPENGSEANEPTDASQDKTGNTEGILKFTDELPTMPETQTQGVGKNGSVANNGEDYIDDNYEPENYKEQQKKLSNGTKVEEEEEEKIPTTMTVMLTTTRTTTTTSRPTSPNLFKPIAMRKRYNYFPPTTTPVPVVIKPRLSLLNPKPAKPPRSYNEIAPKPVIRKLPLLTRKGTKSSTSTSTSTTTSSTTTTTEGTTITVITTEEPVGVTIVPEVEPQKLPEVEKHEGDVPVHETTLVPDVDQHRDELEPRVPDPDVQILPKYPISDTVTEHTGDSDRQDPDAAHTHAQEDFESVSEFEEERGHDSGATESIRSESEDEKNVEDSNENTETTEKLQPRIPMETEAPSAGTTGQIYSFDIEPSTTEDSSGGMTTEHGEDILSEATTEGVQQDQFTPYPILKTLIENADKIAIDLRKDKYLQDEPKSDPETTTAMEQLLLTHPETTTAMELLLTHPETTFAPTPRTSSETTTQEMSTEPSKENSTLESSSLVAITLSSVPTSTSASSTATEINLINKKSGQRWSSRWSINRRANGQKPPSQQKSNQGFNCLNKELYRFYGDVRDLRLFHYCSPGFTSRQVLDFRFVCEEGTTFDEKTQSCKHQSTKYQMY